MVPRAGSPALSRSMRCAWVRLARAQPVLVVLRARTVRRALVMVGKAHAEDRSLTRRSTAFGGYGGDFSTTSSRSRRPAPAPAAVSSRAPTAPRWFRETRRTGGGSAARARTRAASARARIRQPSSRAAATRQAADWRLRQGSASSTSDMCVAGPRTAWLPSPCTPVAHWMRACSMLTHAVVRRPFAWRR